MFIRKLFAFIFVFLIMLFTGCAPARKPLAPEPPSRNEQRPRPIPAPKNVESQSYIDNFISSTALAIPGVKEANAVVVGNVALVGVRFDSKVDAERQKNIRKDISDKISTLNGIMDTLITSEPQKVSKIKKVANRLRSGRSITESWDDLDSLMKSLK